MFQAREVPGLSWARLEVPGQWTLRAGRTSQAPGNEVRAPRLEGLGETLSFRENWEAGLLQGRRRRPWTPSRRARARAGVGPNSAAPGWRAVLVTEEARVFLLTHVVARLLEAGGPGAEDPVGSPKCMESRRGGGD